jgi:hypothetical protein
LILRKENKNKNKKNQNKIKTKQNKNMSQRDMVFLHGAELYICIDTLRVVSLTIIGLITNAHS